MIDANALRAVCLDFNGAVEEFPFPRHPDVSTFKVGGKIFALTTLTDAPLTVSLKCDPELAERLRATHTEVVPGYHLNKRHWNTVTLTGALPDQLILDMIEDSYDLVVASLPAPSACCSTGPGNNGPDRHRPVQLPKLQALTDQTGVRVQHPRIHPHLQGLRSGHHKAAEVHQGFQASSTENETTVPPKRLGPALHESANTSTRHRPRPCDSSAAASRILVIVWAPAAQMASAYGLR